VDGSNARVSVVDTGTGTKQWVEVVSGEAGRPPAASLAVSGTAVVAASNSAVTMFDNAGTKRWSQATLEHLALVRNGGTDGSAQLVVQRKADQWLAVCGLTLDGGLTWLAAIPYRDEA